MDNSERVAERYISTVAAVVCSSIFPFTVINIHPFDGRTTELAERAEEKGTNGKSLRNSEE